jgi:glyoxylase-like metal-dependent hydrolase (beta-lactamase superfamily II)
MSICEKINDNIYFFKTAYKDIFTTVYVVKTPDGALLFDAASFDCDVDDSILPALRELGISESELKYVFISHPHVDHAGGLKRLLECLPNVTVLSGGEALAGKHPGYKFEFPKDGDTILDVLRVVTIPGHTIDAMAILDTRTDSLISGDCLQLYGIFGSGLWGSNINLVSEHRAAIEKLRTVKIAEIMTAHDYHPLGQRYIGEEKVAAALDYCIEPLDRVVKLIEENPDKDDETLASIYNDGTVPTLATRIVAKVRASMTNQ